ncbi:hypothetical protein AAVH_24758 [Aphelenchoides avenae]|nr:hypothetical protein AAVH_24758 [Aphelenchus avenae]
MHVYVFLAISLPVLVAVPLYRGDRREEAQSVRTNMALFRPRQSLDGVGLFAMQRLLARARRNPQGATTTHYPKVCYYSPIQCLFTRPQRTESPPQQPQP